MTATRRFLRDNGLALTFGVLLLLALTGQAIAGHDEWNNQREAAHAIPIGFWRYVTSSMFATDVMENWQSEYLQFSLYIFATIWLIQRGSPESKKPDEAGRESDEDQQVGEHATGDSPRWASAGGWRQAVYSNSLGIVMTMFFFGTWFAQSVTGRVAYNHEQALSKQPQVHWLGYVTSADFWSRSLQNWQSEFLAIGSMVVLSVYLRQRGSPESKPVGAPHEATGVEG